MTKLSVNINKVALIRNGRGGNLPDLVQFAMDCERFGAEGITIHPRPDERHIRFADIPLLKEVVTTELNIEGYPSPYFLQEVIKYKPHQCTLVPDSPDVLTSNEGWNTITQKKFLTEVVRNLQDHGIRVSLFLDPKADRIEEAKNIGTDRIELYTGKYAAEFKVNGTLAVAPHVEASRLAAQLDLGLNAGHDLNLDNLKFYSSRVKNLKEVSIGHALISDALYFGIHNTIQLYKRQLS